jgi:hypothetical protein
MNAHADKESTIDDLHRRIGRNLLRFQAIEQSLRLTLPYVHPEGGAKGADAMREYRERHVSAKPLGPLIDQFRASITGTPELWQDGLARLLAARNELVHQFYSRFDFLSPNSVPEALEYLDRQYKEAEEWAEIFRLQSLMLLLILIETKPALAAEYGSYREKLLEQLPASLEIVVPTAPNRTLWGTTRIVKLLRLAEQHTQTVNGMTLLSRAGQFIKGEAPDLSAKLYGLRTLKEILIASGLFHVNVEDATTVMYKINGEAVGPLPAAAGPCGSCGSNAGPERGSACQGDCDSRRQTRDVVR